MHGSHTHVLRARHKTRKCLDVSSAALSLCIHDLHNACNATHAACSASTNADYTAPNHAPLHCTKPLRPPMPCYVTPPTNPTADEEVIRQVNADNVLSSAWGPGSHSASGAGGQSAGGAHPLASHPKLLAFKYCCATSPLNHPGRASPFNSTRNSPFNSPRGSRWVRDQGPSCLPSWHLTIASQFVEQTFVQCLPSAWTPTALQPCSPGGFLPAPVSKMPVTVAHAGASERCQGSESLASCCCVLVVAQGGRH